MFEVTYMPTYQYCNVFNNVQFESVPTTTVIVVFMTHKTSKYYTLKIHNIRNSQIIVYTKKGNKKKYRAATLLHVPYFGLFITEKAI